MFDNENMPNPPADNNDPALVEKRGKIRTMLVGSQLIEASPYTPEQWDKIIDVLPMDYLDELYGYLTLEQQQSE